MWEQIRSNKRKSVVLIILIALVLSILGGAIGEAAAPRGGGLVGLAVALTVWFVLSLVAYYQGGRIMLAANGAHKITREDHPQLWNVVEEMTIASGLPKLPDIYLIDDMTPNAFATGRDPDHAAVAVTAGLLAKLNRDQIQGVIAHELGHIKNRDILFMTLMGATLGAIVIISETFLRGLFYGGMHGSRYRSRKSGSDGDGGQIIMVVIALVVAILAPLLAQLIYFAASRRREYLADASAAIYTRYPEGLASALEVISGEAGKVTQEAERVNKATAPMYIINPLQAVGKMGLFSTHPPTEERVRILRSMGGDASFRAYQGAWKQVDGKSAGQLPGSALALAGAVPVRAASPGESSKARMRQAGDLVRKSQGFTILECSCGAKLKIPPEFEGGKLQCPRCGKEHGLPAK